MLAINKIQEVHSALYGISQWGSKDEVCDSMKKELGRYASLLEEFIRANTKEKKGGRLDLFKHVYKESGAIENYVRPAMAGIRHDAEHKVAVSTDQHILIASKADYNAEFAGKTQTKNGELFEGRYPDWKRIMPSPEALSSKYAVLNKETFSEKVKAAQAARKLKEKGPATPIYVVKMPIENPQSAAPMAVYLELKYAEMLLNMPGTLYATDARRAVYYEDDNYQVVIMPRCVVDDENCIFRIF